jgi:WD40 repeat protein
MVALAMLMAFALVGLPFPAQEKAPRFPDEIALPDGAVRLGSAALKFSDGTYGVVFLGDGKRFAILNHNRIRIYETATAREVRGWKADEYVNLAIAATPDGKIIASGGNNDMIRIWDADTGKMIRQFNKHVGKRVFNLRFSPDGKYLVSFGSERETAKDKEIDGKDSPLYQGLRVWDVETGTELPAFGGGLVAGMNAEFTADGKNLVYRDLRDWREGFGKVHMRPLAGGPDVAWDARDKTKWVIPFAYPDSGLEPEKSGALDWHFNIWDGNKDRELRRFKLDQINTVPQVNFYHVRFSHDLKLVASAGHYDGITLWEPAKGTRRVLLPGSGYYGLDFTRDGKTLVACGGYEVRLFDVATGKELGAVGHRSEVLSAAISPDQKTVATAGRDMSIRLWDRATGAERRVLSGDEGSYLVVFLSNETLASPGKNGTLRIWNIDPGKKGHQFVANKAGISSLALTKDGKQLASGGSDGTIRVWDTDTWTEVKSMAAPNTWVFALAFAPDGKSLFATYGNDNTFRMWDLESGKEVRRFNDNNVLQMRSLAVSSDGKLALSSTSSRDKGIMTVWETATGKAHATLPPLDGEARAIAFSPDGKTLVVSRFGYQIDQNLWLIDTTTWKIKGHLAGHPRAINALVFSADGRYLVSASDDSSAVVWDMTKIAK